MTIDTLRSSIHAETNFEPPSQHLYHNGQLMKLVMSWEDAARRLSLRLAPGSRMLAPTTRPIRVRIAGTTEERSAVFAGKPLEMR